MSLDKQVDNLVIGAGIVGVCCARQLQLRGEKVVLADRVEVGEGCSHGNAGVLCTWSMETAATEGLWKDLPKWILDPLGPVSLKVGYLPRLLPWLLKFFAAATPASREAAAEALFTVNNPTVELYRQLIAGTGEEHLVADSSYVFVTRHAGKLRLDQAQFTQREARGAAVRELNRAQLSEMEPALSADYVKAIVVKGQGRATNPGRLCKLIGELVVRDGGEFVRGEVGDIHPHGDGGATVRLANETVRAKRLIVAAGAWSHQVADRFGIKVPLQGERGYHMEFANPGVELHNSISDVDRKYVASSMAGGVRCAGTSEFNALDAEPDWRRAEIMKRLGKEMIPDLNVSEGTPWMGRRPALPDSVPVVSATPEHAGVFFAFGHGHYGLTAAPMTGRMIAAMATGERMNVDTAPFSLQRYQ